jgi:transcriptional regulator with XRE-family HTH domain
MGIADELPTAMSWLGYYGDELQQQRELRKMSVRVLASHTSYSHQQVSNVEAARRTPSEAFSREVDIALETNGFFTRLLRRVLQDPFPDWFKGAAREEALATRIRTYQAQVVHGLFQTEDYMRALMARRPRENLAHMEAEVQARLGRQAVMRGETPPLCWMILDESVLQRQIGEDAVMADQLRRLLDEAESPFTVIQVLPFDAEHAGMDGSFTLWSYEERDDVLYVEGLLTGNLLEGKDEVASARLSYDLLQAASLPRHKSLDLIRSKMKEYGA